EVVMICVTHLNAAGKPLGRRIMGQERVVIQLENPDPDQPNRRKLHVVKSHSLYPKPLGVTMGSTGNEYDTNPPERPDDARPHEPRVTLAIIKTAEWLGEQLRSTPCAFPTSAERRKARGSARERCTPPCATWGSRSSRRKAGNGGGLRQRMTGNKG